MRRFKLALGAVLGTACVAAWAEAPPRFPAAAVWHQDISQSPQHPQSASMITTLANLGGFGNGRMQIDFGMHIVHAPVGAPVRTIVGYPSNGEYYFPDCEPVGTAMPVPLDGAIESSADLNCDNDNGDCHLLVVQGTTLYEAYRANAIDDDGLQSQCLAVWKLDQVYPASNRGEHCTSADAAGFPIAPLLFNADEIFVAMQVSGDLGHAIRFILPNARMASDAGTRLYVRPASHAGGPSGPEASVPYGSRLRLRADFPVNLYSPAAQVILRTMQRYGIVLADGGTVALTAESDLFTVHSWDELGIHSRTFDQEVPGTPVRVQDFSVIDTGPRIVETYECVRNPDPGGKPPSLTIADVSVVESRYRPKRATFTVLLSEPAPIPVTYSIATGNLTATAGKDYLARSLSGQVIGTGQTSRTFTVFVVGDNLPEASETYSVTVTDVDGASTADGYAIGTIVNED